jgi:branched-chain amino acid transport system permease protein
MNKKRLGYVSLLLIFASLPFWLLTSEYLLGIFIEIFIFAALALAWNVIAGFGGQLAFGNAIFFGIGAYVTAIGFANYGINPWLGMLLGGMLAAFLAICIGVPSFRLRGIYFALCTFVVLLIFNDLAKHFISFTGGDIGISVRLLGDAPGQFQFDNNTAYYFVGLLLVVMFLLICYVIKTSKFGYYLSAIRNDQDAAESLGISSPRVKLYAFMASAFMTAMVGAFYVQYTLFIDPDTGFGLNTTVQILTTAIAGGLGHLWGPVLGAFTLIPLGEITNFYLGSIIPGIDLIVYSIVLIVIVKVLPHGIVGLLQKGSIFFKRGSDNEKNIGS